MPLSDPRSDLKALKLFVKELEERYLARHLANQTLGAVPREEELDVAAFTVLTHGAFENFVEGLALWSVNRVEENWKLRRRASRSTASLMMHTEHPVKHDEQKSVYDTLRKALEDAKESHSGTVKSNHGIEPEHLRTLLSPVGIDVPTDVVLIGSLGTLVKMRHQWAHQYRFGAKESPTAGDALKTAQDCIRLAEELYRNTMALRL